MVAEAPFMWRGKVVDFVGHPVTSSLGHTVDREKAATL